MFLTKSVPVNGSYSLSVSECSTNRVKSIVLHLKCPSLKRMSACSVSPILNLVPCAVLVLYQGEFFINNLVVSFCRSCWYLHFAQYVFFVYPAEILSVATWMKLQVWVDAWNWLEHHLELYRFGLGVRFFSLPNAHPLITDVDNRYCKRQTYSSTLAFAWGYMGNWAYGRNKGTK